MSNRLMKQQLLASTIIAGAVAVAAPAIAQNAPTTVASAPADNAPTEIVVTGSRIPHPELESASPVTSVSALQVKQTGTTRVEDLLNAMPQVFGGQGGNIANGATGTSTLDLRDLGPQRTLVLINGRRVAPGDPRNSNSEVADINLIPGALIKRVDILTGGASSVYGADAVAGVVNFQMDTNFDGFKLDSQYSFFNHQNRAGSDVTGALNARGFGYPQGMATDGATIDSTVVMGAGFDDGRGHVTAYGGYRKIKAVTQDRRDYSACTLSANSAAAVGTTGRLYSCGGSGTSAPGTFYTATGGPFHVVGNQFVAGTVPFNYAPYNYFQRPDERYTAGAFAHYDVSDALKPYMEFMFMDDRSVAQIAPSGDFFNTTVTNCDNPLLSAQERTLICGARTTGTATLYAARRNVEGGGRQDDLQHTTYRGVIGSKGQIAKGITYDAYYQFSRTNFAQTYRNDFSVTRLKRSLLVSNVNGVPTCQSVVDGTDPNCVPYNIFAAGGVTPAALAYLQIPLLSRGQTQESIAEGSLTFVGSDYGLTSPWANEGFALNVGGQYRKDAINFEVDTNFATGEGAGQGGATKGVAGGIRVSELFAEASLPVIQGKPFFEDLTLGAGYRRSSYKTAGTDPTSQLATKGSFKTDTYKFEVAWAPVRDFKFRGTYNRAVRAPLTADLYGATTFGLDGSVDPCAGAAPTATRAQCALTGVTTAQYGTIAANPASQYNGYLGGNSQLTPEISDSYTLGVVITPKDFIKNFQLTVDWFDIKLKNRIATYGFDNIMSQCITSGDPFYCGLIHRGPGGTLWRGTPSLATGGYIVDTNVNAGKFETRGVDVTAAYNTRLGKNWGNLGFTIAGTYLDKFTVDNFGPSIFDCAGLYGPQCGTPAPKWRHNARVTYTIMQGSSISLAWRYFSKVKDETSTTQQFLKGTTAPGNANIAAQSYFDLSFTIPLKDKVTLRFGAQNILDRSPPLNGLQLAVFESGNTFPQVYDALGRYVYAGLTFDL